MRENENEPGVIATRIENKPGTVVYTCDLPRQHSEFQNSLAYRKILSRSPLSPKLTPNQNHKPTHKINSNNRPELEFMRKQSLPTPSGRFQGRTLPPLQPSHNGWSSEGDPRRRGGSPKRDGEYRDKGATVSILL